jgi:hypothetical protein
MDIEALGWRAPARGEHCVSYDQGPSVVLFFS